MYNQHRVFARFQTPADFELFMNGIISAWRVWVPPPPVRGWGGANQGRATSGSTPRAPDEHKIRARIAQLQEWRTFGITSLAGGEVFELERKRRVRAAPRVGTCRVRGPKPDCQRIRGRYVRTLDGR